MPSAASPETIAGLFLEAERRSGDRVHLMCPDRTSTYGETLGRARKLAGLLAACGVGKGDRVAAVMDNSRAFIEINVATALLAAVCVPVNGANTSRENTGVLMDCEPLVVLADLHHVDRLHVDLLPAARFVTDGSAAGWRGYEAEVEAAVTWEGASGVSAEDPALIVYSSGTTGKPKGIVLGHGAIVLNARMTLQRLGFLSSDVFLTLLPLYSSFGYSFDFIQAALAEARTVVEPRFSPRRALQLIESHGVTCLAGVTTMFVRMFAEPEAATRNLSTLRLLDVGGGPVPDSLKHELATRSSVTVVESYGLTEISPVACVESPLRPSPPGSCGPPLDDIDVRVSESDGEDLPAGQSGELLFRSATFMLGYWKQPQATAEVLRDGWLHSGDLGKVDSEGNVYILDRIKDLIVTSGNNVYPKEVENILYEHPAVESAAVVGIQDPVRGEAVHAFIVLARDQIVSAQELLDHCRANLAVFKVPRDLSFVGELPLTGSGKIRRAQLREYVNSNGGAPA